MPPKTKNPTFPRVNQNSRRDQSTSSPVRRSMRREQSTPGSSSSVRRTMPRDQSTPGSSSSVLPEQRTEQSQQFAAAETRETQQQAESQRSESEMNEELINPMAPLEFYFNPSQYLLQCKMQTRCDTFNVVTTIEEKLENPEKEWFINHPQFKHIFHMFRQKNRKLMGMFMLLLRTVKTDKRRQCWFVINGVPIRYSIREHGLLSGLYCHEYPREYEQLGSLKFVWRHFGKNKKKITVAEVLEKFMSMPYVEGRLNDERLKMAVLYFLSAVIKGRTKMVNGAIEPFILRVVDDLSLCETFPWGRYTFDDEIKEIFHMVDHFKGRVQATWTFPGFILPLEILAFECIPALRSEFRETIESAHDGCPRMCKAKFRETGTRGYGLNEIYEALGDTKDICSILVPENASERGLMRRVLGDASYDNVEISEDSDSIDFIVDGWNKFILRQNGKIWWENLYNLDIQARAYEATNEAAGEEVPEGGEEAANAPAAHEPPNSQMAELMKGLREELMKVFEEEFQKANDTFQVGFREIYQKVDDMDARLKTVEANLKEHVDKRDYMDAWDFPSHGWEERSRGRDDMDAQEERVETVDNEMDADAEKEKERAEAEAEKEKERAEAEKEKERAEAEAEKEKAEKERAEVEKEKENEAAEMAEAERKRSMEVVVAEPLTGERAAAYEKAVAVRTRFDAIAVKRKVKGRITEEEYDFLKSCGIPFRGRFKQTDVKSSENKRKAEEMQKKATAEKRKAKASKYVRSPYTEEKARKRQKKE